MSGSDTWVRNDPGNDRVLEQLVAVWRYRQLVLSMAERDILTRFKQTIFGLAWAVIQPIVGALVFTLAFNQVAGVEIPGGGSYLLFAFSGSLLWTYFSSAVSRIVSSVVANRSLVEKVYFPRLVIPVAAAAVPVLELGIGLIILLGLVVVGGNGLGLPLLTVPIWLLGLSITAIGPAVAAAAANVRFRDVGSVASYAIQLLLFLTPVAYPASLLGGRLEPLQWLNPLAAALTGFRWSVGLAEFPRHLWVSALVAIGGLWIGVRLFVRAQRRFVDVI